VRLSDVFFIALSYATAQLSDRRRVRLSVRCALDRLLRICTLARRCHNIKTRSSAVAETARRFVSLNIPLTHSRSLKIARNDTFEYGVYKSLLASHRNYVCISYRFWLIRRQI